MLRAKPFLFYERLKCNKVQKTYYNRTIQSDSSNNQGVGVVKSHPEEEPAVGVTRIAAHVELRGAMAEVV